MKHKTITFLTKYILPIAFIALFLSGCKQVSEDLLLKPKAYFENSTERIEVGEVAEMTYPITARLSAITNQDVELTFDFGEASLVDEYNKKNGTEYLPFDATKAQLSSNMAVIKEGSLFTTPIELKLSGLDVVEEGKSYLIPIRITSSNIPLINGSDVIYYVLDKPIRITTVWRLVDDYVKIPLPVDVKYKSVTYEALIMFHSLRGNNTVMGNEGRLIFRVGDSALPGGANNLIQIAGNKQFHSDKVKFTTNQWYHVAFTYDVSTGAAIIYVNGEKIAESKWQDASFDLGADPFMSIGRIERFMWGTRPTDGYIAEARLWSVARTQQQIQNNMLGVDPKSNGLEAYYRLNGKDQVRDENGRFFIQDASPNGLNGLPNGGRGIRFVELDKPIEIK